MKTTNKTRERLTREDVKDSSILFNRHMAAYLFCLKYIKNKKVLDLGCSDGYGSFILAKKAKAVTAVDIDTQTIEEAKKKYNAKWLNFAYANALSLPYRNEFDIVISLQVIEHMPDVDLYLSNIQRALKKDGICILSTPNRLLRLYRGQKPWNKFHIKEYEPNELGKILKNHFSKVEVEGVRASPEIYRIEKKRLYLRRLIARIDIFNIYERLPRGLADSFLGLIKQPFKRREKNKIDASVEDFWINKKDLEKSLDLIAICRN